MSGKLGVSLELCHGIPSFLENSRTLDSYDKKHAWFKWTPECQADFEFLKESLTVIPLLAYPDTNLPYKLYTDASANYIRAFFLKSKKTMMKMEIEQVKWSKNYLFPVT